jgi:hypothetical protein
LSTEFVLDENTAYTRILDEVRSDGGERLYVYGTEGFSTQQAVGGAVEYPLVDGLGSVRQLTDVGGTASLTRSNDAYGNVGFVAGAGVTRLGYTGEMQAPVSGLVYLRARHCHPVLSDFHAQEMPGRPPFWCCAAATPLRSSRVPAPSRPSSAHRTWRVHAHCA